jgi:hypothetical protein
MKNEGVGKLGSVRRWFRTVAIDVCLFFNVAVVCSSKYFRFLFVKLGLLAIGLKIGEAHQNVSRCEYWRTNVPLR